MSGKATQVDIPTGWTPRAWAVNLDRLARRCEELVPERAAELRDAATAINDKLGPARICAMCELELGGPAVGRPVDPGEVIDIDGRDRLVCRACAWRRERAARPRVRGAA